MWWWGKEEVCFGEATTTNYLLKFLREKNVRVVISSSIVSIFCPIPHLSINRQSFNKFPSAWDDNYLYMNVSN